MELFHPYTTSVGTEVEKVETVETNWNIMGDNLMPRLSNAYIEHPDDVSEIFKPVRGNYNAKSAIESAIWDLYPRENNMSLSKAITKAS